MAHEFSISNKSSNLDKTTLGELIIKLQSITTTINKEKWELIFPQLMTMQFLFLPQYFGVEDGDGDGAVAAAVAVDAEVALPDDICPRTSPGGFCVV